MAVQEKDDYTGFPSIADPGSRILGYLQSMGVNASYGDIYDVMDYPVGSDDEFLRHYFLGMGSPFIDFMVWVDIGVGWELTPKNFPTDEAGQKVKDEIEQYFLDIDLITTMVQFATYYYVLGRAAIVFTLNLSHDDFFYDKLAGITGIDVIDPSTLDAQSIKDSLADITGKTPFIQKIDNEETTLTTVEARSDKIGQEIKLARDRIIYRTRNPLSRVSSNGFSSFQNCTKDLQTAAKFPRYRNQLSSKYANLHRHYVVNTEMLRNLEGGLDILSTKEEQDRYLLGVWDLVKKQMDKGATVVTFDFIESRDISFGGREPDLGGVEKQTYEALAFKIGVPLNLTGLYGFELNRATLDTIAQFFIDRRKNGPQLVFKEVLAEIIDKWMGVKKYTGEFDIEIKPFLNESKDAIYNRAATLTQAQIPMSQTEKRREVNLPEEIEYGPADDQVGKEIKGEVKPIAPKPEPEPTIKEKPQEIGMSLEEEGEQSDEDKPFRLLPDKDTGEGKPTEEELDYRTELLAGLAIMGQTIRRAAREGVYTNKFAKMIDDSTMKMIKRGEDSISSHLNENRIKGISRAQNDLIRSPLPINKKVKVKDYRFNNLVTQQRQNVEDAALKLRGRLRQEVNMGRMNKRPDQVIEKNMMDQIMKTSKQVENIGAYGGVKAMEDGYLDTLQSSGLKDIWVDLYPVYDKRLCKTCLYKARTGPYRLEEADKVGNGNPEHPHCRCKWQISSRSWGE